MLSAADNRLVPHVALAFDARMLGESLAQAQAQAGLPTEPAQACTRGFLRRHRPGEMPYSLLKARLKAASDS